MTGDRCDVPSRLLVRAFDVTGALAIGVISAPLWLAAAATIRIVDGAPVLHSAVRVGHCGAPFVLLKFRTMEANQEPVPRVHPGITSLGDPRVTRVGAWLRRTKIDELPQLWNVVRGEMSLVGPRPEDPRYVRSYTAAQRRLLAVRPGLTSPATIAYRHEEALLAGYADPEQAYVGEVLPAKLALDLTWIDQHSLRADVGLLIATARAMFTP